MKTFRVKIFLFPALQDELDTRVRTLDIWQMWQVGPCQLAFQATDGPVLMADLVIIRPKVMPNQQPGLFSAQSNQQG